MTQPPLPPDANDYAADLSRAERIFAGLDRPAGHNPLRLSPSEPDLLAETEREMRDAADWARGLERVFGALTPPPGALDRLQTAMTTAWSDAAVPDDVTASGNAPQAADPEPTEGEEAFFDRGPDEEASELDSELNPELQRLDQALDRALRSTQPEHGALDRLQRTLATQTQMDFEPVADEDAPPAPLRIADYQGASPGQELRAAGSDLDDDETEDTAPNDPGSSDPPNAPADA
ncbi:MAG: hypothetical protein AAF288_01330 [Planctomycetota bacterium]